MRNTILAVLAAALTSAGVADDKPARHPHLVTMGAGDPDKVSPEQIADYVRVFERLDRNGDGDLSHQEFVVQGTYLNERARQGIFGASDADKDGTVTRTEYVDNRIITDEAKAIMARADADKDGTVTRTEFLNHPDLKDKPTLPAIFDALDTNKDGKTTTPEYLRVWGQWARTKPSSKHPSPRPISR